MGFKQWSGPSKVVREIDTQVKLGKGKGKQSRKKNKSLGPTSGQVAQTCPPGCLSLITNFLIMVVVPLKQTNFWFNRKKNKQGVHTPVAFRVNNKTPGSVATEECCQLTHTEGAPLIWSWKRINQPLYRVIYPKESRLEIFFTTNRSRQRLHRLSQMWYQWIEHT